MWTAESRGRMARIETKTKRYPSDLTDAEWAKVAPLLPPQARRGRKRAVDLREILNVIRYMVRSGCEWRMLPVHFPPWQTVYWWFRRFVRLLLFRTIYDIELMVDRERAGRAPNPSAAILDSQTVKAPAAHGSRGFDGAKKTVGRKRHIAVDTDGRLLMVGLTTADISDSAGAQAILDALRDRWPWVKHLFADGAYDRRQMLDKATFLDFILEIVRRGDAPGFQLLPRRWVVERTFGWMTRYRRLVRDYEARLDVSEAMIYAGMSASILRRIVHP